MPSMVDEGVLSASLSTFTGEHVSAAALRTRRADQLGADAASMWAIHMTTPSVNMGLGYRAATESGSGRTRSETNNPGNTAAPGGGP